MPAHSTSTTFAAIRTEGGLLPPDLLHRVLNQDASLGGLTPADFGLPPDIRLRDAIAEAWSAIQTHWASFSRTRTRLGESETGTAETRAWAQQVLREMGHGTLEFRAAAETVGDRTFLVSHRADAADNAPPLHITSFRQDLDAVGHRTGGGERRSPYALVQGYLNATDHLWGVVTNGLAFRLLRENRQIDRVLRVEFDLEAMLDGANYAEFQLFWLVLHRSRFVLPGEPRETAWLERWSLTAASEGTRALSALREGVEKAIEHLGQGLLDHPDNEYLVERLRRGDLSIEGYYQQLLRLVYRLLFLMVAEERDLLHKSMAGSMAPADRAAAEQVRSRYRQHYSVERLRHEVSRPRHREEHYHDLWLGLLVTFDAMRAEREAHALGLEPLAGGLFGTGSCPDVADATDPGTTGAAKTDGRPRVSNARLLAAVSALSEVTREGVSRRVNYRDLDVEELGSVYEGLLEHEPALSPLPNGGYQFQFAGSGERKATGSYYTPRSLVQELLKSALDPVIQAAVEKYETQEAKRRALLALNVCDPACGSGHFLLGAARRIGRRLAEVEAGPGNEPDLAVVRLNVREAIRHCIYGVDKNPLAVDLCKVALWIESHEPGAPIGFLDHHIKRGDSLVGVFSLATLEHGVPDDAYTAVSDDDKATANALKKRNRGERPKEHALAGGGRGSVRALGLWQDDALDDLMASLATRLDEIDALPDGTMSEVQAKANAYDRLHGRDEWRAMTIASDLWTYAYFAPLRKGEGHMVQTSATVRAQVKGGFVPPQVIGRAQGTSAEIGFFHWPLEFPDVFAKGRGGFDTVLGNPPWERVKLQEKEFFAARDPEIATAPNKAARDRLIRTLPQRKPELASAFGTAQREAEGASLFMRKSERFRLAGRGDVNLYSVFAEHARNLAGLRGRAGIIVPTGIATDDTNKAFFADLVDRHGLVALYDFENRSKLFEAVDSRMKFSLLVMARDATVDGAFAAGFFLLDPLDIHQPDRTFTLTAADIALLNPNTKTCPIFRSERDAELTKAIYRSAPVLVNEALGDAGNPWGVTFKTMFHMSNQSHLFRTHEELEARGATLDPDGRFHRPASAARSAIDPSTTEWLPLYEAKLIHQYDHRFATYCPDGSTRDVTMDEHVDPDFVVIPRYWVARHEVERAAGSTSEWFLGFRDITNATNERTSIVSVFPRTAVSNKLPVLNSSHKDTSWMLAFQASVSSFVFDFASRQKIGGTSMNFFIFKQLPVLPPDRYTPELLDSIVPRVLELSYTAHDMTPLALDLGYDGPPFTWDEERRARLRAELDGIYAHLYGISRDDFAYILDTFPIVARNDVKAYGELRTKRLCLEAYDHFAPETLRALELEVREIELALRRAIVRALDADVDALPSHIRTKLRDEYLKQQPNGVDANPTLRQLIDASYLTDLEKIIRADTVWSGLGDVMGSKRQFTQHVSDLNAFRNPMAHNRSVSEDVRAKGEAAIAWFQERLGVKVA